MYAPWLSCTLLVKAAHPPAKGSGLGDTENGAHKLHVPPATEDRGR